MFRSNTVSHFSTSQVPPPERSVWLDLLLRHVCGGVDLIRQSRLLFLVFGPTKTFRYGVGGGGTQSAAVVQCGGSGGGGGGLIEWVMWKEVSEPLEEDRGGTEVAFKPLADALAKCHMMRREYFLKSNSFESFQLLTPHIPSFFKSFK